MEDIARVDILGAVVDGARGTPAAGNLRDACAVAVVQDLVGDLVREIEFQSRGRLLQRTVQVDTVRRVVEGSHQ